MLASMPMAKKCPKVPFGLPGGDADSDGDCDAGDTVDTDQIQTWITSGPYDVRGDLDLDGDVDGDDKAIASGSLFEGEQASVWQELTERVRTRGSTLHFLGLLSDGNVHSHIDHLFALLRRCDQEEVERVQVRAKENAESRLLDLLARSKAPAAVLSGSPPRSVPLGIPGRRRSRS